MESSRKQKRGSLIPRNPRTIRILRGCLWTFAAVLLLVFCALFYVSRNAEALFKDRVMMIADQSLNGTLDFSDIRVNMFGRAVFKDITITAEGEDQPTVSANHASVSLDLFNLFGPNRGQSAIVIVLDSPRVKLIRLRDGTTNLEKLVKQVDDQQKQQFGLALKIDNGSVEFEDRCLLSSDYPRIEAEEGLLSDLLDELDYDILAATETEPHREQITIHGDLTLNSRREEMSFGLNLVRGNNGGKLQVNGHAGTDDESLEMRIRGTAIPATSIEAYSHSIFPKLKILPMREEGPGGQTPSLAAMIRRIDLRIVKQDEDAQVQVNAKLSLGETSLNTGTLPFISLKNGDLSFDQDADRLLVSNLDVESLGTTLRGSAEYGPQTGTLGGRLRIEITDLATLLSEAGYDGPSIAGSAQLDVRPGGTVSEPDISIGLGGGSISYEGRSLGRPGGRVALKGKQLELESLRLSGGDLPLTASGSFGTESRDAVLEISLANAQIEALLALAGDQLSQEVKDVDARGRISLDGNLELQAGELHSLQAQLNGSSISIHGVKLGNVRGGVGLDGRLIAFNDLKISGGELPLEIDGSLDPEEQDADIRFTLGRSGLEGLLGLASGFLPEDSPELDASGFVTADGVLAMQKGRLSSASGTLNGVELALEGVKLGTVTAKLATSGGRLNVESARFSEGEIPVSLSGSSDLEFRNADFSIEAGPLAVDKVATLASRFTDEPVDTMGVTGKLRASGSVGLRDGNPTSSLTFSSDLLERDGHRLEQLIVKGSLDGSSFNLDAATATLVTAEAVDFGSFSSTEPLRVPLRVGGSVSSTGKDGAVSLIGSARTENLQPEQMDMSFKLLGPVGKPQLRIQIKTEHENEQLLLHADAYLAGGMQPANAKLTWLDSQLFYEGEADIEARAFDGKLTASQVSLDRFIDDERISGEFSLDANLSGNVEQPTLNGRLRSPRIRFRNAQRDYELTALDIGFKLSEGDAISVSNGSFSLDRQPFSVNGVLGSGGTDLTVASKDFNLLSALSMVPTSGAAKAIDVQSSGPLSIKISGSLDEPSAVVSYSSGQGSVEGTKFDSARLKASITKKQAVLESLEIVSPRGRAMIEGGANFDPLIFNADAQITNFDVRILTALASGSVLSELTGELNGTITASGGTESYTADGEIRLINGHFSDVDITELVAGFRTHPDGVEITSARLRAVGTTLNADGVIASNFSDSRLTARAEQLDLSLLNPLLPDEMLQLDGIVHLDAKLVPSQGKYPDFELDMEDNGSGITVDGRRIDKLVAKMNVRGDRARIAPLSLEVGGSRLSIEGNMDLSNFRDSSSRIPLDLDIEAEEFQMDDIAGFLPDSVAGSMPGGSVTCSIRVGGHSRNPVLNGSMAVNLDRLPSDLPVDIAELDAEFALKNNEFSISRMNLYHPDSSSYATRVTGSARLAFNPPRIADGLLSLVFSDGGQHSRITVRTPNASGELVRAFEGTVGGTVQIRTGQDLFHPDDAGTQLFVISGNPVINGGAGGSVITYSPGPKSEDTGGKVPVRFDNLTVMVNQGTQFNTSPGLMSMDASIYTETPGLVINGIPNALLPSDQLTIRGDIRVESGTIRAYTNTLRIDETRQNRLHFSGMTTSTGLYPFFSGRATTVLKGALRGEVEQSAIGPTSTDLKVFFDFDNVQLVPPSSAGDGSEEAAGQALFDRVRLSSEPPRSPNQIKIYLLGGVGTLLAGEGEISDVAREELLALSGTFISGQLEKGLGLDTVSLGGTGDIDNPFHVGAEKDINDRLRIGYFRDFYDSLGTSEEISLRYKLFENQTGNTYKGLNLQFNVKDDAFRGSGSELMITYTFTF